jgi:hypothetical protein
MRQAVPDIGPYTDELTGIDTAHRETAEVLAELAADPANELARYRLRHLPRPPDW